VIPIGYLYNALRQTGHLGVAWTDLDTIISSHREANIFCNERLRAKVSFLKQFCVALGCYVGTLQNVYR